MGLFFAIQLIFVSAISLVLFGISAGVGFFVRGWVGWTMYAVLTAAVFWLPRWLPRFVPTSSADFAKELDSINLALLLGGWLLGGLVGWLLGLSRRLKRAAP